MPNALRSRLAHTPPIARLGVHAASLMLAVLLAGVGPSQAVAQCMPQWLPDPMGVPGIRNGNVHSVTLWDRDGNGPNPPLIVAIGDFPIAGGVAVRGIAACAARGDKE